MQKQTTGNASIRTLGFRTAEIMASRGAREGNNAFLKDTFNVINRYDGMEILTYAITNKCSREMYDLLQKTFKITDKLSLVMHCIKVGHRKLAVTLMDDMNSITHYGFKKLHYEVLKYDQEDLTIDSACDVIERTTDNYKITPIHCAAINPNSKYLKQLLAVVAEYKIADKNERKPIHFAAVCEGMEPLEYLMNQKVDLNDIDSNGDSPLHLAVSFGRACNAKVLLEKAKEKAESDDPTEQSIFQEFGLASIDKMNKSKHCPLHLAVINNHLECVQVLLDFGARVDVFTSISAEKLTPLMFACQKGFLQIATYLIEHGARVEARDRFKRTPLIHACIYGNAHIVSYLLRLGANANVFDSSSNTALHYAIAYGWYFCVTLLIEAEANTNCVNCWQTGCLSLGFGKGHYGICDYLLTNHQADVNFKTDEGLTLVMITAELEISASTVQQLEYIVVKHKANCTFVDVHGNNAFHYLAKNNSVKYSKNADDNNQKHFFRLAQILFDHECNPMQMNNKAQTPFMLALETKNFVLINFLINQAKIELNSDVDCFGRTFLHYFAINCDHELFIQTLTCLPITSELKKMSNSLDNEGRTPLYYCALKYDEYCQGYCIGQQTVYESIVNMFRYLVETIESNLDVELDSKNGHVIFYLLRESSSQSSNVEQPLNIFLKKTKAINVFHPETKRTPLLQAIHWKRIRTIDILLSESSCDVNLASTNPGEFQETPFILACKLKYFDVIRRLLNHPRCDLTAHDGQLNQALHYFLGTSNRSDEYLEIFELFVKKLTIMGPHSLNTRGYGGCTPLHIAVSHNLGTVVFSNTIEQILIENNCDLLIKDDIGNIPLHNVFLKRRYGDDPVELCVLICQAMKYKFLDTKNNDGNTALFLAVENSCTVCVMFLLKHHANLLSENNLSNSVLGHCIASNRLNLLITFLHQPIDIDLSKLYVESNKTTCNNSLEFHSKVSSEEIEGTSNRNNEIACWTWKYIPDKNFHQKTEDYSLIQMIIMRNWQGALSIILDELDRFHLSHIQVFEAAVSKNMLDLVMRLLSTIKDSKILNDKNAHGQTLFHILAKTQYYDRIYSEKILNHLFKNGAIWNLPDNNGIYPIHYACFMQNVLLLTFLKKNYPDKLNFYQKDSFNNTAYGILFWSTAGKNAIDKQFLNTFIDSGDVLNCLCNYENDIAIDPLSFGSIQSISNRTILYPPLNKRNASNTVRISPLINAIIHDQFDLAKFLLQLDVDVNFADEKGRTPLMHAVIHNNLSMVKLLLNKEYSLMDDIRIQKPRVSKFIRNVRTPKRRGFFLGVIDSSDNVVQDSDGEIEEKDDAISDENTESEIVDDPPIFIKTSSIDLNIVDELGRTCIHYLVQPFENGCYENSMDLLKLLHRFGASLTKRDFSGRSPLEYTVKNGSKHLFDTLCSLIEEEYNEIHTVEKKYFRVNDPNKGLLEILDYYSDAQKWIDDYILNHSSESINLLFQVDPLSNMNQTGEVLIDTDKDEPYDVRLTITDVDYGMIGLYNFYRMQIIKHKCKTNFYLLFTRWGRIGDGDGQHQLTPYSSLEECRQEFCKVFRDKTGNSWENTNTFEKKPKKYTLIQLNKRRMCKNLDVPINFEELNDVNLSIPSKLKSHIYTEFFQTFLSPDYIKTNVRRTALDVEWMPVSQLKPELIQKARELLNNLKLDIEKKEKLMLKTKQLQGLNDQENIEVSDHTELIEKKFELKLCLDSICQHTNDYYSIIPIQGYGDEKLSVIDDQHKLREQEQKLNDIIEIELSYKILLAAQAKSKYVSPIDYLYKSINCEFEAMHPDDIESQFILRYIWASASNIDVKQIFKIARADDNNKPFRQDIPNHYLLWHGTNVCNLVSILIRGLLVTPLCATATGNLFGKGIYTADAFCKSFAYCSGIRDGFHERCFMFLCEVALGNSQQIDGYYGSTQIDNDFNTDQYQSRKANGHKIPDPRYNIILDSGVVMPLGRLIDNPCSNNIFQRCQYNEYIVFDQSQIALRYLVEFRR